MIFRNLSNNQVAFIQNKNLQEKYVHNNNWIIADEKFLVELENQNQSFELKQIEYSKMSNIKSQLVSLSEDIIQDAAGVDVVDIAEKKQAFFNLLNELRALENKEPKALKQNK